jgi:Trypsin-co-occurring domain 2
MAQDQNKLADGRTENPSKDHDRIPLAGLLGFISSELRAAHESAMRDGRPMMRFQECELEFANEAEGKAGGGVQVYVLKLEGGVKRTETNTIKIKYVALDGSDPGQHTVAPLQAPKGARDKPKRQGRKEK